MDMAVIHFYPQKIYIGMRFTDNRLLIDGHRLRPHKKAHIFSLTLACLIGTSNNRHKGHFFKDNTKLPSGVQGRGCNPPPSP